MTALKYLNAMLELMLLELSILPTLTVISFNFNTDTPNGKTKHKSHALTQPLCKILSVMITALILLAPGVPELPTLTQIKDFLEQLESQLDQLQRKMMVQKNTYKVVSEMRISDA